MSVCASDTRLPDKQGKLQQIYESMGTLEALLKIFCLNNRERIVTSNKKRWYFIKCLITAALFLAIDIFTTSYKIQNVYSGLNVSIAMSDFMQVIFDYVQYLIDLFFVFKYGKELSIEYYRQYESFDVLLDMNSYSEIKRRLAILIGIFLFLVTTCGFLDFMAWQLGYGWLIPLAFSPSFIFFTIKILTILDLSAHVMNIECRLRIIGDVVQDTCMSTGDLPKFSSQCGFRDAISNKNWFYSEGKKRCEMRSQVHPFKNNTNINYNFQDMRLLDRCYLLLSEQCTFINRLFGIRILLNSLSLLIDMVRFLNVVVRIAVGSQQTVYNASYFPAASTLYRFLVCLAILVSLVRHCELVYRQQDRVLSIIDHILVNKKPDESLRNTMTELQLLMRARPITFNMAHFFTLNYSFLMSMASVVVTYTIIMLQSM